MKFLVSLLGLGVSGGGVFIGTLQQNLSNIKTEVDILFEEIEDNIRKFSEKHHITEKDFLKIKMVSSESDEKAEKISKASNEAELKNTLRVWTTIWLIMLDSYIYKLWVGDSKTTSDENLESRVFSKAEKQAALDAAEKNVKHEKGEFEEKLPNLKSKIEEIYQKMKKFLQIMKLPKKYNNSDHGNTPYEEYVNKILKE